MIEKLLLIALLEFVVFGLACLPFLFRCPYCGRRSNVVRLGREDCVSFKFLVGDGKEFWKNWLEEKRSGIAGLQPVWGDEYKENLRRALELVREYPSRFLLSVQMYKYIGVK